MHTGIPPIASNVPSWLACCVVSWSLWTGCVFIVSTVTWGLLLPVPLLLWLGVLNCPLHMVGTWQETGQAAYMQCLQHLAQCDQRAVTAGGGMLLGGRLHVAVHVAVAVGKTTPPCLVPAFLLGQPCGPVHDEPVMIVNCGDGANRQRMGWTGVVRPVVDFGTREQSGC